MIVRPFGSLPMGLWAFAAVILSVGGSVLGIVGFGISAWVSSS